MLLLYVLGFCRITVGLVFAISFASKVPNISAFEQTITRFGMLPKRLSSIAAHLFLGGELIVVLLMMIGGPWLWLGFGLAIAMLLAFSTALALVLMRNIRTSCNCFGPSEKQVSRYDLWRNTGFILCALGGCGALAASKNLAASLGVAEWGLLGAMAGVLVLLWVQLGAIIAVFRQS